MIKTLINYLTYIKKKNLLTSILFNLINSALETFSLATFVIILNILINKNFYVSNFLSNFNLEINFSKSEIIFVFILILILKSILLIFYSVWKNNFLNKFNTKYTSKLFNSYLSENYDYFINKNSSELVRNIYNETRIFSGALNYCFQFLSEIFNVCLLLIFLIIFNLKLTIFSILISIIVFFIFTYLIKNKIYTLGLDKLIVNEKVLGNIKESFDHIKDVKIYKIEKYLTKQLNNNLIKLNYTSKLLAILGDLPKSLIEILILTVIVLIFLSLKVLQMDFYGSDILILATTYLAASIKLIPSILRIINYYNIIQSYRPSIEVVDSQLKKERKLNFTSNNFIRLSNNFLELKNIFFEYPNSNFKIKNLNLSIYQGEILLLSGESGVGKSTLLNLISGFLKPLAGNILMNKVNIHSIKENYFDNVSYVFQDSYLFNDSIRKNITLSDDYNFDHNKFEQAIKNSSCDFIKNLKDNDNFNVGENGINLSGGQIQRILLARALYKKPKILLLDEFTNALDTQNELEIIKNLQTLSNGMIIVISSHNKNLEKVVSRTLNFSRSFENYNEIQIKEN